MSLALLDTSPACLAPRPRTSRGGGGEEEIESEAQPGNESCPVVLFTMAVM